MTVARIGFAYNPTIEAAVELRDRAGGWCSRRGIAHWAAPAGELPASGDALTGTDVLVVLGGDGTFLRYDLQSIAWMYPGKRYGVMGVDSCVELWR